MNDEQQKVSSAGRPYGVKNYVDKINWNTLCKDLRCEHDFVVANDSSYITYMNGDDRIVIERKQIDEYNNEYTLTFQRNSGTGSLLIPCQKLNEKEFYTFIGKLMDNRYDYIITGTIKMIR